MWKILVVVAMFAFGSVHLYAQEGMSEQLKTELILMARANDQTVAALEQAESERAVYYRRTSVRGDNYYMWRTSYEHQVRRAQYNAKRTRHTGRRR